MQTIILSECKGTVNYLDDVLVFGRTQEEHDKNLQEVLKKFEEHNVKINKVKCSFGQQEVKFLGFKLSVNGWQIEDEKISGIKNSRKPKTQAEVKSSLGTITYIERFIPQRADKTRYLRELANAPDFYWNENLENEFNYLKDKAWNLIKTLGYYSREDETELFVDASPYGLGAVLVQYDSDSNPRIIACASKTLTPAEKKYPHTQKEALAMVWGVERFSVYLLSIPFTIRTDAESNEFIFGGQHRIGKRAVSRAEAWALRLQPYDFKVARVPGEMNVADALSRLITDSQPVDHSDSFDESSEKHLLYFLDTGMIEFTWEDIELEAEDDEELEQVREAIRTRCWRKSLKRYESERRNLRVLGALVFSKDRVILPNNLRQKALQSAHQGHMGAAAMKKILRSYFWWPGMAKQVESFVKGCETCFRLSQKNPPIPLTNRELPEGPWEILQIDFFSFNGCGSGEFLVVVDIYSRYLHVIEMKSTDAENTNEALFRIFEIWGYPLAIHSDNGPPFQGDNFVKTWENKGVKIRKSIPLSAQSNGAVERQNKGIKEALIAPKLDNTNWKLALQKYIHMHNKVRPLSRLGVTPFELLVGWRYRGTFPFLWETLTPDQVDRTDIREKDAASKLESKKYADRIRGARESDITVGDRVALAQNTRHKSDPTFSEERFTVLARDGAKVVVQSDRGVQYSRNVQDVKKVPITLEDCHGQNSESPIISGYPSEIDLPEIVPEYLAEDTPDSRINLKSPRPKRSTKKPSRFNDMVLYCIFD